jgi:arylsulfatase A-like enzyme
MPAVFRTISLAASGLLLFLMLTLTLTLTLMLTLMLTSVGVSKEPPPARRPPNFIVVFVDDLGYSDIGPFGAKKHRTPVLDQMAKEGMCLTDFYSTCSVCTPSRSSLMTGCYPRRVNMHVDERNLCVLFPAARKGLNPAEITIAELLKKQGYATACIGKWHLGDHPDFLPTSQGFDSYFGIPYSNDMHRKQVPLPLVRNETVIEVPVKQATITARYTAEAVKFIETNKSKPFFLYLPHTAVHVPLFPGKNFRGKSSGGRYGDWVEEVDWSMGELFKTLKRVGVDERTLVLFTSDNGSQKAGSNDPLRGRKGRTDEGGMRVPCVVRWPGKIPAGRRSGQIAATIDLLPTFARLAGTTPPADRVIDGGDIWPILSGAADAKSPHEAFYYYQMDQLQAVRSGKWKMFVALDSKKRNWGKPEGPQPLKLFDLSKDIHEDHNVAESHPEVVKRLSALAEKARADLGDTDRPGKGQRKAGWVKKASPRLAIKKE